MNTQIILVTIISLLVCVGGLALQREHNNELRESISEVSKRTKPVFTVTMLEAETSNEFSSEERIQTAREEILASLEVVLAEGDSPFAVLKGLPSFLSAIEELEADEILKLREELKVFFKEEGAKYAKLRGLIDEALVGLAAEQNPNAILSVDTGKEGLTYEQQFAIASLARSSPTAAIDWLGQKEMAEEDRRSITQALVTQLLLEDSAGAIEALRACGVPWFREKFENRRERFLELPAERLAELEEAARTPGYEDVRPLLGQIIVQSLFPAGVAVAREKAEELGLEAKDLDPIFHQASLSERIEETGVFLDWMGSDPDLATEDGLNAVSHAMGTWANQAPTEAWTWLGNQPPSAFKDHTIQAYAFSMASKDLSAAFESLAEMQNSVEREAFSNTIIKYMRRRSPEMVEAWLSENPEMDSGD